LYFPLIFVSTRWGKVHSHLSAQLPVLTAGTYRVRIITQYTGGSALLKEARQLDYNVDFTVL
jgi:hypothetical protein